MSLKIVPIIVLLCSFACSDVKAQSVFIKVGANYSYLKEPSYGEPGVSYLYGIGKDLRLYRGVQLRTELLISNAAMALKNRSVQTSDPYDNFSYLPNVGRTISYLNIDIQLRYLEIPLLLKVDKSLSRNLSIGLEIGYSLKFCAKDASQTIVLRRVKSTDLSEEERRNFRFDYRVTGWPGENYSYNGRGLCPTFGTHINYSRFQVELCYQVDYVDWVTSIVIGENIPLRILILSMGYQF